MSSVLITGGAGFIGCRLARVLDEMGCEVVVVDNLHPQVHPTRQRPSSLPESVRLIVDDVVAPDGGWAAMSEQLRPQVVIHLAAETGTAQSLTAPTRHASVNVGGAAALVEGLEHSAHQVEHVLLASSRAVYGDGAWTTGDGHVFYPGQRTPAMLALGQWDHRGPDGAPAWPVASVAGETRPDPASVYAATKLAQEHVLAAWCTARGVPLSILRLQNVYGVGQSPTNSYTGVVTAMARAALAGQSIDVFEDGAIVRDFVHVDDVVRAFVAAIERPRRRLLDIGSGRTTTILELAGMIAAAASAPAPVISGRYRLGDVRAASASTAEARSDLGFSSTRALADGVAEVISWLRTVDVVQPRRNPRAR